MAETIDSGIYMIRCKIDNKVYIGQSIYLKRRMRDHQRKLETGTHPNTYLQHAVDKYGISNFDFRIVERCNYSDIDNKERYWIHYFRSSERDFGYNMEDGGHNGRKYSEDRVEALTGENNSMFGKHQTEEVKQKIQSANRGMNSILTVKDVSEIKKKYLSGKSQKELAEEYQVHISTINKIVRLKNWEWVEPQLNNAIFAKIDDQKLKVKNTVSDLSDSGLNYKEIAKIAECGASKVSQMLNGRQKVKEAQRAKMIAAVERDYKSGISKEDIMKKYNISKTSFTRYTSRIYNEQKENLIDSVYNLRKSGMLVKDIAYKLGLHRTTVTEYWKIAIKEHGNIEG